MEEFAEEEMSELEDGDEEFNEKLKKRKQTESSKSGARSA